MLGCDAGPVIDRCRQAVRTSFTHFDPTGFPAALGDWRDPSQSAQGVIISGLDGLMGLREQRGEDDPSYSRQRAQDRGVALLGRLPRFSLRLNGKRIELSPEVGDGMKG